MDLGAFPFAEISQVITAVAAVGAVVISLLNRGKIQQVHLSLNSRLSELLARNRDAAHLEGKAEGRLEEQQRKNGDPA